MNILPRHDLAQANCGSVDANYGYCFQQRLVFASGKFRQIKLDKMNRRKQVNDGGGQYVGETYYYLGMAREGRGALDKALQNYITALTFNPNFTPAHEARDRLRAAQS